MAHANSQEKNATREQALGKILNIPGVVGEPIWQELADEARVYLELHTRLSKEPLDSLEREYLEDKMIISLAHLATHSQVLYASIDETIEALPLNESEKDLAHEPFEKTTEVEARSSLDAGMTAQEALIGFWNYWKATTDEHTKQIANSRKELERILRSNKNQDKKETQITKVLDTTAATIERHTIDLSTRLPSYRRSLGEYIEGYSKFVFWLSSSGNAEREKKQELYDVLVELRSTLRELANKLSEYIVNVQNTGRSAIDNLNHVKLSNACNNLVNKLVGILDTVKELDAFNTYILEKLKAEAL